MTAALSFDDLASQSGVDRQTVDDFVDAGVLQPSGSGAFKPSDVATVRLVASLVESGLELEVLSDAVRDGRLSFAFIDHLIPDPVRLVDAPTDGEGAVSLQYATYLEPILGSVWSEGEPIREDDLVILRVFAESVDLGASTDSVVRILRSIAQSATKVINLYRDFIDEVLLAPAIDRTGSPILALEETSRARLRYRELGKEIMALMMDRVVDDAIHRNLVDLTESALLAAGVHPEEDEQTIVFLDVSNYTRLSEERGDGESALQAALLTDVVSALARKHGGRLVKSLGDGAMVYVPYPDPGLELALDAVASAEEHGLWELHAGVNTGPMVRRDGDFFGSAVNVASRVADVASAGEVVVTDSVVAHVDDAAFVFEPLGESTLKNVGEPVALYRAERRSG